MHTIRLLLVLSSVTAGLASVQAQNKTIAPAENLVVDGIPRCRRRSPTRCGVTPSSAPALRRLAPDAREMLISTRFGNTAQVHRVKIPGGDRTQLTFFNEPVSAAPLRADAGHATSSSADVGGNEFTQLYRYDLADGRVTLLTDGDVAERRRRVEHEAATASPTARRGATAPTATST